MFSSLENPNPKEIHFRDRLLQEYEPVRSRRRSKSIIATNENISDQKIDPDVSKKVSRQIFVFLIGKRLFRTTNGRHYIG